MSRASLPSASAHVIRVALNVCTVHVAPAILTTGATSSGQCESVISGDCESTDQVAEVAPGDSHESASGSVGRRTCEFDDRCRVNDRKSRARQRVRLDVQRVCADAVRHREDERILRRVRHAELRRICTNSEDQANCISAVVPKNKRGWSEKLAPTSVTCAPVSGNRGLTDRMLGAVQRKQRIR